MKIWEKTQQFSEKTVLREDEIFRRRIIAETGGWLGFILISIAIPRYLIAPLKPEFLLFIILLSSILASIPKLIRRNINTTLCSIVLIVCIFTVGTASGFYNGGVKAPATVLFALLPIIGFFCNGILGGKTALTLSILGEISLLIGEHFSLVASLNQPDKYNQYKALVTIATSIAAYFIGTAYEHSRRTAEKTVTELSIKASHSSKMASLGEMSAGIAHEINNPLAIISGSTLQITRYANDPEKLAIKAQAIQDACNRISRIVGGLKKFSRSGEKSHQELHSLSKILKESLILTEAKASQSNTKVTHECRTEAQIQCDEVEIEQVLVNLISNAIDAIKQRDEKWVRVSVFEDESSLVLQVMDSGPGIPKEIQAKLFDPFFTTKPIGEGTGFGLAIVKGILEEHQATITVLNSTPNTCFEIRFKKLNTPKIEN